MKAEMGKKMAVILPGSDEAPAAMYTAMQTSQLQSNPRMKACANYSYTKRKIIAREKKPQQTVFTVREVFDTAVAAAAGPAPRVPPK